MGQMRFHAPMPEALPADAVELAYMAGMEAIPWQSRNQWLRGELRVERKVSESGNLYIPWHVTGHGNRVLSTCSLMERKQPYSLPVELARGTLYRARCLAAQIESRGILIPDDAGKCLKTSLAAFVRATTSPSSSAQEADACIAAASDAIALLSRHGVAETLTRHYQQHGELPTLMAGHAGHAPIPDNIAAPFTEAFHAAVVPFRWRDVQPEDGRFDWSSVERQIKWCQQQGLRVLSGPLLQLDRLSLPDWIYLWEDDYETFESYALAYVSSAIERFEGFVDIWNCAGRMNVGGALELSEEHKLRLAVAAIETVRHSSPRTPVIISFDQPWAEYLSADDYDLSPLHFADTLVRAELGVAGIGLEMNLGYWPGGTLPRDLQEISQHMDRWSLIGIPLIVCLTAASSLERDPLASGPSQVVPRDAGPSSGPAIDQRMAEQVTSLLVTKPALHGIVWNQLSDGQPHEFPHSGLLDASGEPKPLFEALAAFRRQYLT